jgi:hypothetical protein
MAQDRRARNISGALPGPLVRDATPLSGIGEKAVSDAAKIAAERCLAKRGGLGPRHHDAAGIGLHLIEHVERRLDVGRRRMVPARQERIPNQPVRHTRHHFPWCQCRLGLRAARPWIPPEVVGWLCFGNRAILSLRRFQKVAAEASKARCRAWRPRLRFGQCPYPGRPWAGDPSA